jgi:hypothetical protein
MRATGTTMISRDSIVYRRWREVLRGRSRRARLAALQASAASLQSGSAVSEQTRSLDPAPPLCLDWPTIHDEG